jgi:antitoxin component YwqK of YwqJK toxin-antitoxin module
MNVGYFINGDYVIEIDIIDDYNKSQNNMINQTYAEYYTEKYKILSITNWKTGLQKNKIKNYKLNDIIHKKKAFVKNKDIAIQNIFKDIDKKNKNEENEYLKTKTGIFINYYKNGQIYKTFFHNNGKKEGEYKKYYENGLLCETCNYFDNKKYGENIIYDIDSNIESIKNYYDDKLHGNWKEYSNKELIFDANYNHGISDGNYIEYYGCNEGQIKISCNYKDGNYDGKFIRYYENGDIERVCNYIDGKLDGICNIYFEDGQLEIVAYYKNGKLEGEYKEYYSDGQLLELSQYKNGKYNGEYKKYSEDGAIIKICNYINGKIEK